VNDRHYAYFPGCTLSTTGKAYDVTGRAVAAALGIALEELPDWNCCGATFPLNVENVMALIGPARVLMSGEQAGSDVATLCAVCFNVLRRTGHFLQTHPDARERLNLFVEEGNYTGEAQARHLLGILRDDVEWEAVQARVTAPLMGLRVAPYYGCLLLRPEDEVNLDNPESPTILHELLTSLGAEVVDFSHQVECCGSYLLVSAPEATKRSSTKVTDSAQAAGADMIATACPLCQYNLARTGTPLPVLYFTELMAAAFGLPEGEGVLAEVARDGE